jgi:hypothetical protein
MTLLFSGMTSFWRLPKSYNSLNVCNKSSNQPFLHTERSDEETYFHPENDDSDTQRRHLGKQSQHLAEN